MACEPLREGSTTRDNKVGSVDSPSFLSLCCQYIKQEI